MAQFKYVIINSEREREEGLTKAADIHGAVEKLQIQGHSVVSVTPVESPGLKKQGLEQRLLFLIQKIKNRVPTNILVFFTRQLATMFSAGMTLERSLELLSRDEQNKRFKKILQRLNGEIKKGRTLSEALATHEAVFGHLYVALVKSGEIGGTLNVVLDDLADYLERSEDVKRKVISALYYPGFVMFFLVICVTILMLVIAPKFHAVYTSFGAQLPLPTLVLMNGSKFVLDHIIISFLSLAAAVGAVTLFSLSDRGSYLLDALKLKIPFFGLLIRESLMSRFSRTLGLLLTSSVPVLDALHYVSFTLSNAVLKRAVHAARERVKQGKSLHHALEDTAVFPSILTGLVATGEETGKIESLLAKVADFYDNQVSALITRMTSVIEPVLIIIVAVVVGAIVVVMYLPLFYLGLALRRGI